MKTYKEWLNEIKVETYKDCVWYLDHSDKCKMADAHGINLPCHCKEKMDDFCIWITQFLKSSSREEEVNEETSEKHVSLLDEQEEENSFFQTIIDAFNTFK